MGKNKKIALILPALLYYNKIDKGDSKMGERKYSIKKIISRDYAALLSFICFVIMAVHINKYL